MMATRRPGKALYMISAVAQASTRVVLAKPGSTSSLRSILNRFFRVSLRRCMAATVSQPRPTPLVHSLHGDP